MNFALKLVAFIYVFSFGIQQAKGLKPNVLMTTRGDSNKTSKKTLVAQVNAEENLLTEPEGSQHVLEETAEEIVRQPEHKAKSATKSPIKEIEKTENRTRMQHPQAPCVLGLKEDIGLKIHTAISHLIEIVTDFSTQWVIAF